MFALGFGAGSVVAFVVLAVYGYKNSRQQMDQIDRNQLERYYWMGYRQGVEDKRDEQLKIDELPVYKN